MPDRLGHIILGLFIVALGAAIICFARAILRDAISIWSVRKDDPLSEFMKERYESGATVIGFRVFGSFLVLIGVVVAVSLK